MVLPNFTHLLGGQFDFPAKQCLSLEAVALVPVTHKL